jgi:hypothetical protein
LVRTETRRERNLVRSVTVDFRASNWVLERYLLFVRLETTVGQCNWRWKERSPGTARQSSHVHGDGPE